MKSSNLDRFPIMHSSLLRNLSMIVELMARLSGTCVSADNYMCRWRLDADASSL